MPGNLKATRRWAVSSPARALRSCALVLAALGAVLALGLLAPGAALAMVPAENEEVEYGTKLDSPCSLVNEQTDDEAKLWTLWTLNPKRRHSSESEEELAPAKMPRPEAFPAEPATLYSPRFEGEEVPTEEGCEPVSADSFGTVVEGDELAVYEPGPYMLEQLDSKVHWELVKNAPTPTKCGGNDQYYPDPNSALQPPEIEPPDEYSWEITSYCNTVKPIKFNVLGGEGLCSGQAQDMSLFPAVPYFNQYDTGARLDLPVASSRKGGNACGPSSLLMAMRWNIDFTAARQGWSTEELIDATKALPSMLTTYDQTMLYTRAAQGSHSNHLEWERALHFAQSKGWSGARLVCLGTTIYHKKSKTSECKAELADIASGNEQKILGALDNGPILISTVFSTRRWGETGGGHVIMVFGPDRKNPNDVDVYDPAGNYFSTPKTHYADTVKGGHYGPSSCGYGVPYPLSWLLAYTTGRVFISLGPAPAADPPVISISDAEPGAASAPENFFLQDSSGRRAGWFEGKPVEEIPGSFAGQTEESPTDPGIADAELEEPEISPEEPAPAPPRTITLQSPPPGTTLHVGSEQAATYALKAEEWKDGEIVGQGQLNGPVPAAQDELVSSPVLDAAIADTERERPPGGQPGPGPAPTSTTGSGGGNGSGGPPPASLAGAARVARIKGGKVVLKLTCRGPADCQGVVRLSDHSLLGKASFAVPAGATRAVSVKLSKGALAKLLRQGASTVRVKLSGRGVMARTLSLKTGSTGRHR